MDMSDNPQLLAGLRGSLRAGESMARHVSWRAGGRARVFYQPADVVLADAKAFISAEISASDSAASHAFT